MSLRCEVGSTDYLFCGTQIREECTWAAGDLMKKQQCGLYGLLLDNPQDIINDLKN